MSRTPTPHAELYRWHTAALAHMKRFGTMRGAEGTVAMTIDEPQVGWFKRRLVRKGPWVAARIWMEQPVDESGELVGDEVLHCEVDGVAKNPNDLWSWLCGNPISEADYLYMVANSDWAKKYAPSSPAANPETPISTRNLPAFF